MVVSVVMLNRRSPWLLATYTAFIVLIIFLADTGQLGVLTEPLARIPYGDKLGHFMLFGMLGLVADFALRRRELPLNKLRIPLGPLLVLALATLEEISQIAVATRTFDLGDLLADLMGVSLFVFVGRRALRTASKNEFQVD